MSEISQGSTQHNTTR